MLWDLFVAFTNVMKYVAYAFLALFVYGPTILFCWSVARILVLSRIIRSNDMTIREARLKDFVPDGVHYIEKNDLVTKTEPYQAKIREMRYLGGRN